MRDPDHDVGQPADRAGATAGAALAAILTELQGHVVDRLRVLRGPQVAPSLGYDCPLMAEVAAYALVAAADGDGTWVTATAHEVWPRRAGLFTPFETKADNMMAAAVNTVIALLLHSRLVPDQGER